MGLIHSKKKRLKIRNLLPKSSMLDTEGKILKDADFNILVFEIRIKGYFETRVRLWPQNHPLEPSTHNVSFDSGIDCAP